VEYAEENAFASPTTHDAAIGSSRSGQSKDGAEDVKGDISQEPTTQDAAPHWTSGKEATDVELVFDAVVDVERSLSLRAGGGGGGGGGGGCDGGGPRLCSNTNLRERCTCDGAVHASDLADKTGAIANGFSDDF
jgi:hypothetical protein